MYVHTALHRLAYGVNVLFVADHFFPEEAPEQVAEALWGMSFK